MQLSAFPVFRAPNDPSKEIVTSGERLEKWFRFLINRPLVFDYETTGLNYYQKAVSIGIGIGSWDDQGRFWSAYVPYRHMTGEPQMDIQVIGPGIKSLLECPDTLKIAHNIKFEDHFSRKEGWKLSGRRYDTMIAAHMYDENSFINLENRAAKDLGLGKAAYQGKDLINSCVKGLAKARKMKIKEYRSAFGYAEVPIDICGYYGCFDVTHCGNLCSFYESKNISSTHPRIFNTEMELTEVLCDTEENGLPLNVFYLEALRDNKLQKMEAAEIQFKTSMGGMSIAFGSDDQVRSFMRDTLGLRWEKLTDKNKLSVDKDVIESFAKEYHVLRHILDWRDASKIVSTYTTSLIKLCDSNNVLHGNLQQMGTVTGRLSCKDPNYQNMPSGPEIRQAFHVRGKGWVRLFLDYSQIELRVLAYYSRDPIMVDVYLKNGDIHERTQKEVATLLGREVPRRHAKVVNFGLCLAEGQRVLTLQDGLVPIESVKPWHLVWDGIEWVSHDGLVCRGEKEVITYDGITATPDHQVYLEDGTTSRLEDLESGKCQGRIAIGACGETPIRYEIFNRLPWSEFIEEKSRLQVRVNLYSLPLFDVPDRRSFEKVFWTLPMSKGEVSRFKGKDVGTALRRYGSTLSKKYSRIIPQLQGAWNQNVVQIKRAFYSLVLKKMARYGFQGFRFRSHKQRGELFPSQFAISNSFREFKKQKTEKKNGLCSWAQTFWKKFVYPSKTWNPRVSHLSEKSRSQVSGKEKYKVKVYDLLNAGPRHRFTIEGKIVSNSYGLSAKGLSVQSGMPQHEAEDFMQKFFQRYWGIDAFRKELCAYARRNGNQISNIFGRTRRMPDLQSSENWKRSSAERRLIGSIIQGQAAELTKESMVRISRWLKQTGVEAYLVNTVHDEIQLDMPKKCLPDVLGPCKMLMENYPEFYPIPVVVDAEVTDLDWGHKWEIVEKVNPDEPKQITLVDFMARPTVENVMCQVVG